MSFLSRFEQFFIKVKQNRWIWLFSIFCRVSLAFGFLAGGFVKIIGERFASGLSIIHPMGSYLNALHFTKLLLHIYWHCTNTGSSFFAHPETGVLRSTPVFSYNSQYFYSVVRSKI
ncbi:hypothetical protein LZ575_01070 [Antarcticibacterium sp. 1MA-6-2]|uniref:hypothetical protein n=1 Tax=Antarcticibacterium sp. 1MA-6-2 TaxID=2908210 RepID=UPI001F1948F7|nr:hypothetical protein [Antarcticibacterium sp. 1MA-6-2]UJH91408.1 hypothetical protein LZ575_01070 [Antarcticibacterium sp. 1MA-6-2]